VLGVAAGLAVLGEVLEFVLGVAGSRQAGDSTRAAALAIVGSFIGGILGTVDQTWPRPTLLVQSVMHRIAALSTMMKVQSERIDPSGDTHARGDQFQKP
jgi:hypothetical protein